MLPLAGELLAASLAVMQGPSAACPGCQISLELVGTYAAPGTPGELIARPSAVVRDSRGHLIVAPSSSEQALLVYHPDGRFLRQVGRIGSGPGEYRMVRAVAVGPGDSLFVFDQLLGRVTVLAPDFEVVQTLRLPFGVRAGTRLVGGDFLVEPGIRDPLRPSYPLVRISVDGARMATYGDSTDRCNTLLTCVARLGRRVWPTPDGGFWSARTHFRYELERRAGDGSLIQSSRPAAEWFVAYDSLRLNAPDAPPTSSLDGVWADAAGRLWTLGRATDPAWRRARWEDRQAEGRRIRVPVDLAELYDGIVEVRDGRTGQVLANLRVPAPFDGVASANHIYRLRTDDVGFVIIDVYRVSLSRTAG